MRLVLVTCGPDDGPGLVRTLVEERLVACGNIISGVRSIYRWQGQVCDEAEQLLIMETEDDRVEAMMARLREIHPYEVPKILTFTPAEGLPAYLDWVREQTRPV